MMNIIVNNTPLSLFEGATVADAVRAYYVRQGLPLPTHLPETRDRFGNQVAHDGPLTDGSTLTLVPIRPRTRHAHNR